MSQSQTYLVTGGTGYIASYVILDLLEQGNKVRTSIRSKSKESQIRKSLVESSGNGLTKEKVDENLEIFIADLVNDEGWDGKFDGVDYVLHIASPLTNPYSQNLDDFVIPATKGTKRVLELAAKSPSIKRVTITSSFAAIGYGHPDDRKEPFTEEDWSVISDKLRPYQVSKTLAEKVAWDFIKENEGKINFQITVINPNLVIGPTLKDYPAWSASVEIFKNVIDGTYLEKGLPRRSFSLVDVRDVAKIHIGSLHHPGAANERFILNNGRPYSFLEIANIVRDLYKDTNPELVAKIPTKEDLSTPPDYPKTGSITKAKTTFQCEPTPNEITIRDTVDNLIALKKL
ncbi:putative short chain dehydrogenase [Scheffersomyces amazonensis]|uniref:putative short chain dehydrogenase n=1 Tax=Scheffersomyces amazonensis TaxID=1078765 RepID=UPI00315D0959